MLSNRSVAWLMFAAVVLGGFAIPAYFSRGDGAAASIAWPLDDRIWSTGALLAAHELTIGTECSTCHARFFQRVQDAQCTACPTDVRDHVQPSVAAVVGSGRCATCHKEHNEPERYLIVRRDSLCTDCHAEEITIPPSVGLAAVTGFTPSTHPPFDVHV